MGVFTEYAHFYDLYYANKDYSEEADFVLKLASRFGSSFRTLLDMGCGTGRHLVEFAKRGFICDGFDLSAQMLAQARERLSDQEVLLSEGNLTNYENGKQYDLVVSMFAVMGYLVQNEDLISGLRTARKHLQSGGVFIFDGWFGPAVLSQKPEVRCHKYRDGQDTVVRKVTPLLDPVNQKVTVRYEVVINRDGQILKHIEEEHQMRFMFIQEMALAMEVAELELVYYCPFMMPNSELTTETWNISFVARRKS